MNDKLNMNRNTLFASGNCLLGDLGKFSFLLESQIILVDYSEVTSICSEDQYSIVNTNKEKFLIREPLISLINRLPPVFFMIHRSAIINLMYLNKVVRVGSRRYQVELNDFSEMQYFVGRTKIKEFLGILNCSGSLDFSG